MSCRRCGRRDRRCFSVSFEPYSSGKRFSSHDISYKYSRRCRYRGDRGLCGAFGGNFALHAALFKNGNLRRFYYILYIFVGNLDADSEESYGDRVCLCRSEPDFLPCRRVARRSDGEKVDLISSYMKVLEPFGGDEI